MRTTITHDNRIIMTLQADFDVADTILFRNYMSGLAKTMAKIARPGLVYRASEMQWSMFVNGWPVWVRWHHLDVIERSQEHLIAGFTIKVNDIVSAKISLA